MSYSSVGNSQAVTATAGQCIPRGSLHALVKSPGLHAQHIDLRVYRPTYLPQQKAVGRKGGKYIFLNLCGGLHAKLHFYLVSWGKKTKTKPHQNYCCHSPIALQVNTTTQQSKPTAELTSQGCNVSVKVCLRKEGTTQLEVKCLVMEQSCSRRDFCVRSTLWTTGREKRAAERNTVRRPRPPAACPFAEGTDRNLC